MSAAVYGLLREGFHDAVACSVGVKAVGGQRVFHCAAFVDHGAVIVHVDEVLSSRVGTEPVVEGSDFFAEEGLPWRRIVGDRRQRTENDSNVVALSELDHGLDIGGGLLEGDVTFGKYDVVGSSENDDNRGVKVEDILLESPQHRVCRLAGDAAADVGFVGKELGCVGRGPDVCDGVAIEDDAARNVGGERLVLGMVALELSEV